ncbi:predicted protein [Sclerotinia sclerotiorum 1980 UF-70]|uniref:Uncharacterized protein n=1 Tax=Sclerotinia sclerotiorum (strain ATCC 18683 / 1980 / Ss-1) TaxID=665079 RepID=A7ENL9_SCLS1|nr:predicted protein [Sclerotinia sclerotiorum 1980 UF-70]EDO04435.1 predicted protein [Sclerotinia sclerotiorum 1980 UF-70]
MCRLPVGLNNRTNTWNLEEDVTEVLDFLEWATLDDSKQETKTRENATIAKRFKNG